MLQAWPKRISCSQCDIRVIFNACKTLTNQQIPATQSTVWSSLLLTCKSEAASQPMRNHGAHPAQKTKGCSVDSRHATPNTSVPHCHSLKRLRQWQCASDMQLVHGSMAGKTHKGGSLPGIAPACCHREPPAPCPSPSCLGFRSSHRPPTVHQHVKEMAQTRDRRGHSRKVHDEDVKWWHGVWCKRQLRTHTSFVLPIRLSLALHRRTACSAAAPKSSASVGSTADAHLH